MAAILNEMRRDALNLSPLSRARMLSLRLSANDLLRMYYKYIGVLGGPSSVYRFEQSGTGAPSAPWSRSRCSRSGWNAWCTTPS